MPGPPLAGVVIIELGQVIAGTYGGTILADLGAEVIKVEPLTGDSARNPGIASIEGHSAIHLAMNRGKRSIALDLKSPEGLEVFERLVAQADAVIDNFRPGVMRRLGIHHDRLQELKPGIVTCSVTGFGQTGPSKNRPAFDLVIQAVSGHLHITGDPEGAPSRVGIPLADMAGSLFACISVLAGLLGRQLHGEGQNVDVGMLDSLVSMLGYDALHHLNTGTPVQRHGTAHAHMVPWQAYAVRDGYIVIAAREEKFWARVCNAVGRPDLDRRPPHDRQPDPRREPGVHHRSARGQLRHADPGGSGWRSSRNTTSRPRPSTICPRRSPIRQVQHRGLVRTYEHPELGPIRYLTSPAQFEGWSPEAVSAPVLGQDTTRVLVERLGYSDDDVARMADAGAIGVAD